MKTLLQHRITSLERWGMRAAHDFQSESCVYVKNAGYTGVLVNGGSGFGPDMMTPESLVASDVLPNLMPATTAANRRELQRRCELLNTAGLDPWLCVWGVPGPDQSADSTAADSNRFFDRRSKLEMTAAMLRSPDRFGHRNPRALSWRGNRPLCISHPTIDTFYRDLYRRLPESIPGLRGVLFFPGDGAEPECCDDTCPRCRDSGRDAWARMFAHTNAAYRALQTTRPGLDFYFCVWNQDHPNGRVTITRFLDELDPGIGLAMSLSDNAEQARPSGTMIFNQPWSMFAEPGSLFQWTADGAHARGRPVMIMGEISQSEVWDPVCHNVPTPHKTLDLLRHAAVVQGAAALLDFWGNRSPFIAHANHAVLQEWLIDPTRNDALLLTAAAARHYGIRMSAPETADPCLRAAVHCWQQWNRALDDWALCAWAQRFSYAIGRDAARGKMYLPLIPCFLDEGSWGARMIARRGPGAEPFLRMQKDDRARWLGVATEFEALAERLGGKRNPGAAQAQREAVMIKLGAELIVSIARTAAAMQAWKNRDAERLRTLVHEEIDAREQQLQISGRLGLGAGVNPLLVSEDIQNMRLFIASHDFPDVPPGRFHWTPCPYSI